MTSILKIVQPQDSNQTVIYYMSTREDKPGERHAYSVQVPSKRISSGHYESLYGRPRLYLGKVKENQRINERCYTCDQTELSPPACLFNRVQLSRQATYFVHECLGPQIPYSTLRRTDISDFSDPWLNNDILEDSLSKKLLPTVETVIINKTDYCK